MITHRFDVSRRRKRFEAVILIITVCSFAPLARAQDQDASTLPDGWKGQLIYETTSSSSMSSANIVLTISGTVPFSMDGGHLSGQGTLSYVNEITAGGCDTKINATIEVSLDGEYDLGAVAKLVTLAADAGTPDAGSPRVGLKIKSTSKMSGFDGGVNCRGKSTKIPPVPQLSQAQTSQIKLPMKDGGQGTQEFSSSGFKAVSTVTEQLPCPWDYTAPIEHLKPNFENDPREGPLYPQTPNESLTAEEIKNLAIAKAKDQKRTIQALENKDVEGLTLVYLPTEADVVVGITSQPAKFGPGKVCAWDISVQVKFPMMEVYVAKGLPYDSCVRKVAIQHERKHEDAYQQILMDYAKELEHDILNVLLNTKLRARELSSDANLDEFKKGQKSFVGQAVAKLKGKYDALLDRSTNALDDLNGAEMQGATTQLKNKCKE